MYTKHRIHGITREERKEGGRGGQGEGGTERGREDRRDKKGGRNGGREGREAHASTYVGGDGVRDWSGKMNSSVWHLHGRNQVFFYEDNMWTTLYRS